MRSPLHRHALSSLAFALLASTLLAVQPAPAAAATDQAATDPTAAYGRMMLVLDSSGSMAEPAGGGQTKMEAAQEALHTVIDGLPDEAQVGLRVFGATVFSRNDEGACTDSQVVVKPGTGNRSELSEAVDGFKPYGETPIPYALQQAAQDLGGEGARSIVLVSDGESTCDPDPCDVAAELAKDGIDLQIDVVGLSVSGAARKQLKCIADNGNGTYYDADSAADIASRLIRVAQRAVRPFTITGSPIAGGSESAPTTIGVGDWVDTIGPKRDSRSYAFERATAGTTLRVSAFTQGERGASDGLTIKVNGPDGKRCDVATMTRSYDARQIIAVQVTAGDLEGDGTIDGCAAPGTYVVTVTRSHVSTRTVPLGIRVTEEPPVTDAGFVDPTSGEIDVTAPQVSGQAQHVEGGASFANATDLGPGAWSSTVVPGEALMYRIPVEFGQSLRVSVVYPPAAGPTEKLFGNFPPVSRIVLYSPMQAQLGFPGDATFSDHPDDATLLTATPAVARQQADPTSQFSGGADYATSGAYYLGVSVQREDYTVELPFTINVEVVGDAASGPTYADGARWTVADGLTATGESVASPAPEAESEAEAPADGGVSSGVAIAAGGVALVALVGVGVAILRGRRRG